MIAIADRTEFGTLYVKWSLRLRFPADDCSPASTTTVGCRVSSLFTNMAETARTMKEIRDRQFYRY